MRDDVSKRTMAIKCACQCPTILEVSYRNVVLVWCRVSEAFGAFVARDHWWNITWQFISRRKKLQKALITMALTLRHNTVEMLCGVLLPAGFQFFIRNDSNSNCDGATPVSCLQRL